MISSPLFWILMLSGFLIIGGIILVMIGEVKPELGPRMLCAGLFLCGMLFVYGIASWSYNTFTPPTNTIVVTITPEAR